MSGILSSIHPGTACPLLVAAGRRDSIAAEFEHLRINGSGV